MEHTTLDVPFLVDGVAHVAFWNGRVLTAEDLKDEQQANLASRRRLGRAVGSGIAAGLRVLRTDDPFTVDVTAGVAIDRYGQPLELPVDVTLSLVIPSVPTAGNGVFVVCSGLPSATPSGTGLYLLVLRPAEDQVAGAPGVDPFGNGAATECGPRYTIDGVSFRLLSLDADGLAVAAGHDDQDRGVLSTAGSAVESPLLRNTLAHLLLDTQPWHNALQNPFALDPDDVVGAVESLRDDVLAPCEVPLAVLAWSSDGVDLVDNWSVRRPIVSHLASTTIEQLAHGELTVLARASYSQFQDHLAELHRSMNLLQRSTFSVTSAMRYLPAAGIVPIGGGGNAGFNAASFFAGLAVIGPVPITGDEVAGLLSESFGHRPIDLESGEVVHVYRVLDATGDDSDYLLFTTGRMDFRGDELRIEAVFPAGSVSPGQQIEIRGRGFGLTRGLTRIRFNEVATVPLSDSSDTRLTVIVPITLVVPAGGLDVVVEISNGTESDSVPIVVVRPTVPVLGDLHVEWLGTEPSTLPRGGRGEIVYNVRSALNQAADVSLVLDTSSTVAGVAGFAPIPGNTGTAAKPVVNLEPDEVLEVRVVVDPIPAVDAFDVSVGASADTVVGQDTRTFETETEINPPDPTIELRINGIDIQSGTGSLVGNTVTLTPGSIGNVNIIASLSEAVDYLVRAEPSTTSAPWGSVIFQPLDGTLDGGGAARTIILSLINNSATGAGTVVVIVNRAGRDDDARLTFLLDPGTNP